MQSIREALPRASLRRREREREREEEPEIYASFTFLDTGQDDPSFTRVRLTKVSSPTRRIIPRFLPLSRGQRQTFAKNSSFSLFFLPLPLGVLLGSRYSSHSPPSPPRSLADRCRGLGFLSSFLPEDVEEVARARASKHFRPRRTNAREDARAKQRQRADATRCLLRDERTKGLAAASHGIS